MPSYPRVSRFAALFRVQEAGLLLVILLLGALLTFGGDPVTLRDGTTVNNFLRIDNLLPNVATPMAFIAIMSLGVTFVIASGGIDISVGSISALAALATAGVLQRFPEDASAWVVLPAALGTALGVGLLCGLVNGALVVGLRIHPFIVTLGTLSIFRGIALISVPTKSLPSTGQTLPLAFTEQCVAWTIRLPREGAPPLLLQPAPLIALLACLVAAWIYLSWTVGGRQIYAVGGNEQAARFAGLPIGRIKLRVYAVCGLSCGLAGLLSAGYYGSASTATNEGYELIVVAAAVVGGASLTGGRGTALGAVLGALVIRLIENGIYILKSVPLGFATLTLSREYSKIIIGIAILLAVAVDRAGERWRARS